MLEVGGKGQEVGGNSEMPTLKVMPTKTSIGFGQHQQRYRPLSTSMVTGTALKCKKQAHESRV